MSDSVADLAKSLVEAYRPYVEGRIDFHGLEGPDTLIPALEEGTAWLRTALEGLLNLPFADQRRGPLELFQEAMRFPTEALAEASVPPVARDRGAAAALPGDVYDLAPASSRLLGERVWLAHLAWGAAKARDVRRPRLIGLLSGNLMDRTKIESQVLGAGGSLFLLNHFVSSRGDGGSTPPDLALIDLEHSEALPVIKAMVAAGTRVVAFGPHVDRSLLQRAELAGAEAVARSAFYAKLGSFLG